MQMKPKVSRRSALLVKVDLGFSNWTRQYLRLRGLDCPELATEAGKRAKSFVESRLKPASYILLTSSRSDKFDRYLADVFIPTETKQNSPSSISHATQNYLHLNNELLHRKFAVRVRW